MQQNYALHALKSYGATVDTRGLVHAPGPATCLPSKQNNPDNAVILTGTTHAAVTCMPHKSNNGTLQSSAGTKATHVF